MMQDIKLLGMMRSGSTYAFSYLSDRLSLMGIRHTDYSELFNPWARWTWDNTQARMVDAANADNLSYYDHAERLDFWNRSSNSTRLLKHLVMREVDNDRIIKDLISPSGVWLLIERDHTEQCLSLLVAIHTWQWNIWGTQNLEEYKKSLIPFSADIGIVERYLQEVDLYQKSKNILLENGQQIHSIRYDHILDDCDRAGQKICQTWPQRSLHPESAMTDPPQKLLTLEEKRALITNLDDVLAAMHSHRLI